LPIQTKKDLEEESKIQGIKEYWLKAEREYIRESREAIRKKRIEKGLVNGKEERWF